VNFDAALTDYRDELVAAAGRWQRTSRRRRRLVLASSALAAALVVAGAAVAATGWLVGAPAPPSVKSDFGSYAPQLGFDPQPGKAVLVASDGPYQLYATTNKQGTYCVLVIAPWKGPGAGEGGDCIPSRIADKRFWAGLGGAATSPDGNTRFVLEGRSTDPTATSVRFSTPDGQTITAPIGASGFFIAGAEVGDPCAPWTSSFVFLDGDGNVLGRTSWEWGLSCVTRTTSRPDG
jgi:hypothetical protein